MAHRVISAESGRYNCHYMATRFTAEIKPFNHLLLVSPPTPQLPRTGPHVIGNFFRGRGFLILTAITRFSIEWIHWPEPQAGPKETWDQALPKTLWPPIHHFSWPSFLFTERRSWTDFSRCTDKILLALVSRAVRVLRRMFWTIMLDFDTLALWVICAKQAVHSLPLPAWRLGNRIAVLRAW